MRCALWLLTLAWCCTFLSGCAATRDWLSSLKESDSVLRHEDKWVEQAGLEARGDRPREMSTEPRAFRQLIMSEQARGIERNLGYYD
jgi:hypothetical protein